MSVAPAPRPTVRSTVRPPGTVRAAAVLAGKDLRRGLKSRSLLLIGVVGPLALGLIMSLAFGGEGPRSRIAVVDRDVSTASRSVVAGLRSATRDTTVTVVRLGGDPVEAVRDGRVDAALVIPSGYGDSLATEPVDLQVLRNPDRAIPGQVATGLAEELAARGDLIRAAVTTALAGGAGPVEAVVAAASDLQPAITVRVTDLTGVFDAPLYFGPLTIFLFLAMGASARSVVREQREGTLDRIRAAPVSVGTIVGGSSLGVFAQGLVAALVVYGVSTLLFGAHWGQPLDVVVVLVALVVALSGLAGTIVALARTEPQAEGWNNALAFVFGILGGAFFGGARFPGILGSLGSLTPNGLAMQALVELGPGGRTLAEVLPQLLGLLLIGVGGLVLGGVLMRRRFS